MGLGIFTLFTPGTKAYATEVNNNFGAITTWADHNITSENLGSLTDTLNFNILNNVSAISIANSGTVSSIAITQSDLLDTNESVIKIVDNTVQTSADTAEFKIEARANTSIPALWVTYGSADALKLLKTHLKIPKATTTEINAISPAEEGSVVFNSSTQELVVRNSSSWLPAGSGSPVGTVVMYAGATAPAGWLICNGDVIPNSTGTIQGVTTDFSALYAVLGSTYGSAGKLPNLGGIFPKGAGSSTISGKTYTAALGTYAQDSTGPHAHGINAEIVGAPALGNWGGAEQDFSMANVHIKNYAGGPQKLYQDNRGGVGLGTVRFAMTSNAEQSDAPRAVTGYENIAIGPATNTYSGTAAQPGNVVLNYIIKH